MVIKLWPSELDNRMQISSLPHTICVALDKSLRNLSVGEDHSKQRALLLDPGEGLKGGEPEAGKHYHFR